MTSDRLEFRFLWNAAEHRQFYRLVQRDVRRRRGLRAWTTPFWVLVLAFSVAVGTGAFHGPPLQSALEAAPYLLIIALWIALVAWGLPHLSARAYERGHAACIPHDQVRVITPDGIEAHCVTSDVKIRWSGISRVVETTESFLFFTTPNCAIQLPKRAAPDGEQLRALRAAVVHAVGSRADLLAE